MLQQLQEAGHGARTILVRKKRGVQQLCSARHTSRIRWPGSYARSCGSGTPPTSRCATDRAAISTRLRIMIMIFLRTWERT